MFNNIIAFIAAMLATVYMYCYIASIAIFVWIFRTIIGA